MDAVEDYLGNCAHVIVDIEVLESLLRPEKLEVSQKVLSEALNKKRQQKHPALRHTRRAEPLRGKQKTIAGGSGEKRCTAGERTKRMA